MWSSSKCTIILTERLAIIVVQMKTVQLPQNFVIDFLYAGRSIFLSFVFRNKTIKHDTSINKAAIVLFARLGRKCIGPVPLPHVTLQVCDRYKPTKVNMFTRIAV